MSSDCATEMKFSQRDQKESSQKIAEKAYQAIVDVTPQLEANIRLERRQIFESELINRRNELEQEVRRECQKDIEARVERMQKETIEEFARRKKTMEEKERMIQSRKRELGILFENEMRLKYQDSNNKEKQKIVDNVTKRIERDKLRKDVETELETEIKSSIENDSAREISKKEKIMKLNYKKKWEIEREQVINQVKIQADQLLKVELEAIELSRQAVKEGINQKHMTISDLTSNKKQQNSLLLASQQHFHNLISSLQQQLLALNKTKSELIASTADIMSPQIQSKGSQNSQIQSNNSPKMNSQSNRITSPSNRSVSPQNQQLQQQQIESAYLSEDLHTIVDDPQVYQLSQKSENTRMSQDNNNYEDNQVGSSFRQGKDNNDEEERKITFNNDSAEEGNFTNQNINNNNDINTEESERSKSLRFATERSQQPSIENKKGSQEGNDRSGLENKQTLKTYKPSFPQSQTISQESKDTERNDPNSSLSPSSVDSSFSSKTSSASDSSQRNTKSRHNNNKKFVSQQAQDRQKQVNKGNKRVFEEYGQQSKSSTDNYDKTSQNSDEENYDQEGLLLDEDNELNSSSSTVQLQKELRKQEKVKSTEISTEQELINYLLHERAFPSSRQYQLLWKMRAKDSEEDKKIKSLKLTIERILEEDRENHIFFKHRHRIFDQNLSQNFHKFSDQNRTEEENSEKLLLIQGKLALLYMHWNACDTSFKDRLQTLNSFSTLTCIPEKLGKAVTDAVEIMEIVKNNTIFVKAGQQLQERMRIYEQLKSEFCIDNYRKMKEDLKVVQEQIAMLHKEYQLTDKKGKSTAHSRLSRTKVNPKQLFWKNIKIEDIIKVDKWEEQKLQQCIIKLKFQGYK